MAAPHILLLLAEQPNWRGARHISYHCHLGIETALLNSGARVTTVMNPFLRAAPQLLKGKKFDQVWAEVFVTPHLDDRVCEWMATLAPIRLGLCAESTVCTEEELFVKPELATMGVRFRKRLPYLTHLALGDETDLSRLTSDSLKTFWWLVSVGQEAISRAPQPVDFKARFFGHIYGDRKSWLDHPELKKLMMAAPHPESARFAGSFDVYRLIWRLYARQSWPYNRLVHDVYLAGCRRLRERGSRGWQRHLESAGAIVNLPAIFKSFPGRVMEGMAANRPMLSYRVPERPRLLRVFETGEEILLFQDAEQLAEQLHRLRADPRIRSRLAEAGRRRVEEKHTTEYRVHQILHWLESGEEPEY